MMGTRTILVVDDEADLRAMLVADLSAQDGLLVIEARTGREALKAMCGERPDITLLDVGLPDMDGRKVVQEARSLGVREPIILLTGHTGEADVEEGFGSGATDYVEKPFNFAKLMVRIRSHLDRHEDSTGVELRIGGFRFSPSARTLAEDGGALVRLTDKESRILHKLHKARGMPVARNTLLEEVWGYNAGVNTHTVETHVYRLRQKLENGEGRFIFTEADGYRLQHAGA